MVIATAGLVLVHLWLSSRISGPSVVYDEAGYLGNARWLAGDHHWSMPRSPAYAAGYPLLLSPLAALIDDAPTQFRAFLVVNAVLLALVYPALVVVLRRVLAVPARTAMIAAAGGALAAPVAAAGVSVIAENLVLPLVVVSVLAAWAMAAPALPRWQRWGYGPVMAALYATHPRFTLTLVVAVGVLVVGVVRGRVTRSVGMVNAVTLAVGTLAARALNTWIVADRWREVEQLEGGPRDWMELLTSRAGIVELFDTSVGQLWYLAAGSLGLVVVGVGVVARSLRAPTTHHPPGAAAEDAQRSPSDLADHASTLALAHLLGCAAAVFVTSVAFFARNQFRIDHYVYGRHNDSFTAIFVAGALSFLLASERIRARATALVAAVLSVGALTLVLNLRRDPTDFDASYSAFAAPSIIRMVQVEPSWGFIAPALVAVGAIAAMVAAVVIAGLLRPGAGSRLVLTAVVAMFPAGWFLHNGLGVADGTASFHALNVDGWNAPRDLRRLGITSLAIDESAGGARPTLHYPFALPDVTVTTFDGSRVDAEPQGPVVLAPVDDARMAAEGARIALLDTGFLLHVLGAEGGLAVWVRPGPVQDRLGDEGALLPAAFPSALATEARRAGLTIVDPPAGPVRVAAGGRVPLAVRVEHRGVGEPWPDAASYDMAGRVQIAAHVTPVDPSGVEGARTGGELPRWMLPGDDAVAEVEVVAVGRFLQPLPPGRYRVELSVVQDAPDGSGELWQTPGGHGASFTLDVTDPAD